MSDLQPWTRAAVNLSEHADNIIHTDAGARAAGFAGALVAGTTIYAYMTHPPAVAWGDDWIGGGGGEVWFRRPVLDGELVECVIDATGVAPRVVATVGGEERCVFEVWRAVAAPGPRPGDDLPMFELALGDAWADYGLRAGDDLTFYSERGIVHPAAWPSIANNVFKRFLVDGPWIHTRSRIYHQAVVRADATVAVQATVVDRFDSRAGERALVDIVIGVDDEPVCTIEHEAIVRLP